DSGGVKAKLGWSERRELEGILDGIEALEDEKAALEALFSGANPDPAELETSGRRYAELIGLIDARIARWEDLSARDGI
ncbi:MAG: ABC transporter C-terminal domain-containing protein, partial [Spirochaetes bacterium]|nr:ABC transporter C-terminal domain-containing protein [Spirochaetota bacterium]